MHADVIPIESRDARRWLDGLSDEDAVFLRRFLLASGTLKELARLYGVSYPTVRLRLDRLIEKVKLLETHFDASPFERRLRALYADGRVEDAAFSELLALHQREQQASQAREETR